jgi:hypothetical protein
MSINEDKELKPNTNKAKLGNVVYRIISIFVALLIVSASLSIVGAIFEQVENKQLKQEAGRAIKTNIHETNQSDIIKNNITTDYKEVMSYLASFVIQENKRAFQPFIDAELAFENSLYLELDSFETLEALNETYQIIENLRYQLVKYPDYIKEVDTSTKINILSLEQFSSQERKDIISGFEESYYKGHSNSQSYINTYLSQMNRAKSLYTFLIENWYSFEISYDDYNEKQIFFDSDYLISQYNDQILAINEGALDFQIAQENYYKYRSEGLKEYGLTAEEIDEYFYRN